MKFVKLASALAVCAALTSTGFAGDPKPFSALAGVDAQELSSSEMTAVYGQPTIAQIDAAILAKVQNPALAAYLIAEVNKLVAMYPTQTSYILAVLTRAGL